MDRYSIKMSSEELKKYVVTSDQANDLLKRLGIPFIYSVDGNYVHAMDLYEVLMDDDKLKALVSTLRNKAFW